MKNDKKKDEKKNEEPKVRDLTGGAEPELGDQALDGVSGGMSLNCGAGRKSCAKLVVAAKKDKQLTVLVDA